MAMILVREGAARRRPREAQRDFSVVKQLLEIKIEQAEKEKTEECDKFRKAKRDLWVMIPWTSVVAEEFRLMMRAELESLWKREKKKIDQKADHLVRVYGKTSSIPDEIRGIKVSDKAIEGNTIPEAKIFATPRVQDVSENMQAALKLPPKTTMHDQISLEDIDVKVEESLTKARWELRSRDVREQKNQTEQEAEIERVNQMILVDEEKKIVDLSKMRVTDLPTCPEVKMPEPRSASHEIQLRGFKEDVMRIARDYKKEKCDQNGNTRQKNLSVAEQAGIKELVERRKAGDFVFCSDKSGKLCMITSEEYRETAMPHVQGDPVIDGKKVGELESKLNCHAYQLARAVGLCLDKATDHRIKTALTNSNTKPPSLYCLIKDHKEIIPEQPIPSRPVCGATESQTGPLGYILMLILNALADILNKLIGTESDSTEDMIAAMESLNEEINNGVVNQQLTLLSTDVKALYPSLTAEESAQIVNELVIETGLQVKGFDCKEAGLYIALTAKSAAERKAVDNEFRGILPVWTAGMKGGRVGSHPGITTAEVKQRPLYAKEYKTLFTPGTRSPNQEESCRMLGLCLKRAIMMAMQNHAYTFGGETYLQTDGGSIGERFTQALARVVMLWWDRKYKTLALQNRVNIFLYKRYVDDVNQAVGSLAPGTRWSEAEKKMIVVESEVANDEGVAADKRTLEQLIKMGNTVCQMIQLTGECPSNSESKKMPVLDLACWIGEDNRLWWQHYRKPVANFQVMLQSSAMPTKMKKTVLTQEVIRVLRNCRLELPWEEKAAFLSELCIRMKASGYGERFRLQIIESGLAGFEKMVSVAAAGGRPVNRKSTWEKESRKKQKLAKSINWHKSGGYHVPLFVPNTPGSELASRIQAIERMNSQRCVRFRVVETGGVSVKSLLQRSSPWPKTQCGRPECFACQREKGGDCMRSGVTYKITCLECKAEYKGETSRNMFTRGKEHLDAFRTKSQSSFMWEHCVEAHESRKVGFSMQQTGAFTTALARQVTEAVQIQNFKGETLNRKSEWRQPAVARPVFVRELD